jgi:hypothetical protein
MARLGKIENLKPQTTRTKEEQREVARMGGIQSGKARREKKLMSKIYSEFLTKKYKLKIDDKEKEIDGASLVDEAIRDIIMRCDSASVSLMKEIRETIEGSKVYLGEIEPLTKEERKKRISELEAKRAERNGGN